MVRGLSRDVLAVIGVFLTIAALWFTNRSVTPKEATWEDVLTEARRGGYQLIGTADLWARHSSNPESLLLVDTRQECKYRTGHIRGALNFPMEPTWLSRWQKRAALSTFSGGRSSDSSPQPGLNQSDCEGSQGQQHCLTPSGVRPSGPFCY